MLSPPGRKHAVDRCEHAYPLPRESMPPLNPRWACNRIEAQLQMYLRAKMVLTGARRLALATKKPSTMGRNTRSAGRRG